MLRAFGVVAALLLAACESVGSRDAPPPSPPTEALTTWHDFPASSNPRPVVWLYTPGSGGFVDANSRMAYFCHKYALATGLQLPPGTSGQAIAVWRSGQSASYPAMTATEAFAALTGGPIDPEMTYCAVAQPMAVTGVRLGTNAFGTDRGTAEITAWIFTVTGMRGELAYPAVVPSAIWGDGKSRGKGYKTTAGTDARTVTYSFYGDPSMCADYTTAVAESSTAVAIAVRAIPGGSPNSGACQAPRPVMRSVTVKLSSAVAGRVVIDAKSNALWLCPAGSTEVSFAGGERARC